ncbi:SUF system Fe-S cluster assembly protein [Acidiluteibacter ferrifornacis]|uniref:SUF system Fe-S cluster assembly protein n=1 Tax=Acidiluteibacter ferrifornacis TaxID=2692424 RepID=A0A6N9NKJ1_9FLAO|nr:SUF system Fe-S cluster assembly protein [Acidiluteibacter ferrifornacis]MBR9833250.1 SUF system Fe-S cluster assembly protein [bacterium]NBG67218.1 SUF system Fe-S cluster assembly protein [Acidiluteibacter ferrifornacis]
MEKNKTDITPKQVEDQVIEVLKTIYDPEIPVNIYELGLIYEVKVDNEFNVNIEMTLTSPNCPVAESMPNEVEQKTGDLWSVKSAKVNIVWEPTWDKDMMSEEAKLELGFL